MHNIVVENILRFFLLMLIQLLILNNIYLAGNITPVLYVLFILMLPTNLPPVWSLLIAFCSGLCVDISLNLLGFHTAAATLVAFCRIVFADRILTKGEHTVVETPCLFTVVPQQFLFYAFLLLLIYNLTYYTIEAFSFVHYGHLILSALVNTIISWILALLYQVLLLRRKRRAS